jgi:flagellar capping protein FliD
MVGVQSADNMGLFSKIKLSVDEKTGAMTGAADALVDTTDQIVQGILAGAKKKETEKDKINIKTESLSNLQTKVGDLQTKAARLFGSDYKGGYGAFAEMYANYSSLSVTTATPSPVQNLIDVNLAPYANLQEFTLEVTQAARYDFTSSEVGVPSATTPLNWSGPFTINGYQTSTTSNMSLNDIKLMLNRQTVNTGVNASIVQVNSTDYRLSLQSTTIGQPINITDSTTSTAAGQIPGVSGKTPDDLCAKFKFNGIAMTRTNNSVNDIVAGLTVVIKKSEAGTVMTVRVTPDVESAQTAIIDWVTSLNALIDEVAVHKKYDLEKNEVSKDAFLYNTDIISEVDALIRNNLSMTGQGMGDGNFKFLEQIGIKTNLDTGKLVIDQLALQKSLQSNFTGVQKLFEYQNQISNPKLIVFDHPDSISNNVISYVDGVTKKEVSITNTMTLNRDNSGNLTASITVSGGLYAGKTFTVPTSAIKISGNNVQFNGDDAKADGVSGSPYAGFEFLYVGANNIVNGGSDSSTIQFTQGFGDKMTKSLNALLEDKTGNFALQREQFSEKIKSLNKAIETINARAEKAKKFYQTQFAKFEAARAVLAPLPGLIEAMSGKSK